MIQINVRIDNGMPINRARLYYTVEIESHIDFLYGSNEA